MTNFPTTWRAAMALVRNETWLVRVATHLLVLIPQLSALEAARAAIDLYEEKQGLEPQVAAALFGDELTGKPAGSALATSTQMGHPAADR